MLLNHRNQYVSARFICLSVVWGLRYTWRQLPTDLASVAGVSLEYRKAPFPNLVVQRLS